MARTSRSQNPPRLPIQDSYTVADLEQVKVLADPLRLRILEAFCEERTTKQVADRLGEKPTKLYHHVDLLDRLGLIQLMRTKKNRGTLEKYYLAVAKTFRVDSTVFSRADTGPSPKAESLQAMVSHVFETTAAEMRGLIAGATAAEAGEALEREEAMLTYLDLRVTKQQADDLRERLRATIAELTSGEEAKGQDLLRYRLTLAYFPLQAEPAGPRTGKTTKKRRSNSSRSK
jgi:DNA-binding transcriptional ArsR family regulator